jgi:hypothetical protein
VPGRAGVGPMERVVERVVLVGSGSMSCRAGPGQTERGGREIECEIVRVLLRLPMAVTCRYSCGMVGG